MERLYKRLIPVSNGGGFFGFGGRALCAFGAYGSLNSEYDVLREISNIYILFHVILFWNNMKYDDT